MFVADLFASHRRDRNGQARRQARARRRSKPNSIRLSGMEALEDRRLLAITLVSNADPNTIEFGNGYSEVAAIDRAISADGRFVAFRSDATNLVPGDTVSARRSAC